MPLLNKLLLLLYITTIESRINPCRSKLLADCFCGKMYYDRQEQFVVNCTDLHFTTVDMLKELPEETQVLIFTGNNIPTLPWNLFGDLNNLSMLKTIDMSNNGIREIKGKSYHHVPNVQRLILNHNNITISNTDDQNYHHPRVFSNFINLMELHLTNAFADNTDTALADDLHDIFVNSELKKLFKLHLEQNEIKGFRDENVFCDLPNLGDLYLGDNYIPSLNFNVTCLNNLRFLDLERNNITKFTQRDLESLDRLSKLPHRRETLTIDVSKNPFRCNSDARNFFYWTQKSKVIVRNRDFLTCNQNRNGEKYVINLKTLAESKQAKVSSAVNVLVAVLIVVFLSLMGVYGYVRRDRLKAKLAPVIDAVTRKVQYTTIESQDV